MIKSIKIMKGYSVLLLLLASILCIGNGAEYYKKVIHNYDPEAKCLDGSPGLVYVHEGGDLKKIMIYFLGGGGCGSPTIEATLESCYQRSKDFLGSSKLWPQLLPNSLAEGYLSTDPAVSAFAGWTKIFIAYCDGSLHQGNVKDPITYKDRKLYFRGGVLARAHINWINSKYDLKGAQKILLTGMSAGGIAVNLWNNYVKQLVGDNDKVYTISDSGIFLNHKNINGTSSMEASMKNIYHVANVEESTPLAECNKHFPGEEWRCLFMENGYPFVQGKFMVVNSEYDAWAIPNLLLIKCLKKGSTGQTLSNCSKTELDYIETYRTQYKQLLAKFQAVKPDLNLWSIACSNHVYAAYDAFYNNPQQKIPTSNGKTVRNVVEDFVLTGTRNYLADAEGWPSNTGCAK